MDCSEHVGALGEKQYTIKSYTPIFGDEHERENKTKTVEQNLFDIFVKYMD